MSLVKEIAVKFRLKSDIHTRSQNTRCWKGGIPLCEGVMHNKRVIEIITDGLTLAEWLLIKDNTPAGMG